MELGRIALVDRQHAYAIELRVREIAHAHVFPQRPARAFRAVRYERQRKHLERRKATANIVGEGPPDNLRITVLRLIEKLRGLPTHLHGRIELNMQATPGFLLDLVRPWHQKLGVERGI